MSNADLPVEPSAEQIQAQPIGDWAGAVYRAVVGRLRADLAFEQLTRSHGQTLSQVAQAAGVWTRPALAARLAPYDDLGVEMDDVFDDLIERGWLADSGGFTLTEAGEQALARVQERAAQARTEALAGIDPGDYVTTINTLRRVIANLGGSAELHL